MILPISALARSSCNSENIFEAIGPGSPQAVRSCVLKRKIKKNDFFSVLALSVSHCSTAYFRFLALPFSPNRRKICQRQNPWQNWELCRTAKASHFGERCYAEQ